VILVTHALHFISYCDYIYTLRDGRVAEQGTYQQLIAAKGEFARLDKEFGGSDAEHETETEKSQAAVIMKQDVKSKLALASRQAATGTGKLEGKLIVKEHLTTGSISAKGNVFPHCISDDAHGPPGFQFTRLTLLPDEDT